MEVVKNWTNTNNIIIMKAKVGECVWVFVLLLLLHTLTVRPSLKFGMDVADTLETFYLDIPMELNASETGDRCQLHKS